MNTFDGNVFFLGSFDENMEQSMLVPFIREVQKQRSVAGGYIDLYINSMGGAAHLAFMWVSQIETAKRAGVIIRTIVPDAAYSAGSLVAITGTPGERYMERSARHLIHWGQGGALLTSPEHAERVGQNYKQHFDQIFKTYNRYCDIPDLKAKMQIDDYTLTAAQCIKFGVADKYMEKFDIGYE